MNPAVSTVRAEARPFYGALDLPRRHQCSDAGHHVQNRKQRQAALHALAVAAGLLWAISLNGLAQAVSTVQFASSRYTVIEDGGMATIVIQRRGNIDEDVEVLFSTSDGGATADADYVPQSFLFGFQPGETNKILSVPILNDALIEGDEAVNLYLSPCGGCVGELVLGIRSNAVLTILDNDRIEFTASRFAVYEHEETVFITVRRGDADTNTVVAVDYATRDGTSNAGSDYTPQNGTLSFAAGETVKTIRLPILNDAVGERDETFVVALFNPQPPGSPVGSASEAVVTIRDDDRGVEFFSCDVEEGAGRAVISVQARTESANGFSVDFSTEDGSATAGMDYVPQSGTLNFAPGETEKTFDIPILDDALGEGDETVNLRLSHPVGVALGAQSNTVLWIRDNDPSDSGVDLTPQRVGIWTTIPGGASAMAVVGNYAYVAAGGLQVLDISDPAHPRRVGGRLASGSIPGVTVSGNGVVVSGNYAYVVSSFYANGQSSGALDVMDISDPANPTLFGRYEMSEPNGVALSGQYACVAWSGGLLVIDVSNPANPRFVASYRSTNYCARSVAVSGNLAYLGSCGGSDGLQVIDISDPANPLRIGGYDGPDVQHVALAGNYAFLAGNGGMIVLEVSDPTNPQWVGAYSTGDAADLAVSGGYAYVTGADGFVILDVSQPPIPRRVGGYPTGTSFGLAVSGNHAYVSGVFDLAALDISVPTNVVRVGSMATLSGPQDVAVSGNYVYVADGPGGLLVIDASDVAHPRPVGRAPTRNEALGVAVVCNDALVAERVAPWVEGGGLEVFDVSNPENPRRVGQLDGGCSMYAAMAVEGSRAALTVLPDVYCGGGGGLDIIDLSDTANPQKMGGYRSRAVGDALDLAVSGDFAYLGTGGWSPMQVFDLSDPANPQKVGDAGDLLRGTTTSLALSGNFVYVADDYSLSVIDVSDPTRPQQVGTYAPIDIGTPPFWRGVGSPSRLAVAGGRLYVAGSAGLELIDVRDPAHPRQAAFYRTEAQVMAVAVRGGQAFLAESTGLEIIDLNPLGFRPGSITRLASGQMQFTLNTRYGQSYTVQASTNLVHWESLETRTAFDNKLTFTDTNGLNFRHRFYRAVSP